MVGQRGRLVLALLPAGLTLYFASLLPSAAAGRTPGPFSFRLGTGTGTLFSFRADGLGLLFALLISGVGALVFVYARRLSQRGSQPWDGSTPGCQSFMAAMLGVALADNILLLFVFWELTSISSYMLIGFEHDRESARFCRPAGIPGDRRGGLALLAGLLLLGARAAHSNFLCCWAGRRYCGPVRSIFRRSS
jgi:multicomponent Na+:H+ antiporter subunit A